MSAWKPNQNPDLAWREIEGEVMIVTPGEGAMHELNATGSFLWKLADGTRTVEEIASALAEEFDVTPEAAMADTRELLAQLAQKDLLVQSGEAVHA